VTENLALKHLTECEKSEIREESPLFPPPFFASFAYFAVRVAHRFAGGVTPWVS